MGEDILLLIYKLAMNIMLVNTFDVGEYFCLTCRCVLDVGEDILLLIYKLAMNIMLVNTFV